ncbi:MMPL family transporter [Shewanella avicenniae]|uniref:MMPL family transporter n=1 Tax=Shewanella avicenniae TaxID=2814294 RepID=A0ABX7QTA4_9GAMM|nr:MMPL family transporter [Shewanella avicenniae]QSX33920.1 MMPL family transporter [Shewanella avicenniae]
MLRLRLSFALWLMLLSSISAVGIWQWQQGARIETDILAMLPTISQDPLIKRAQERVEQQFANRIYLALVADNQTAAVNAAKPVLAALKQSAAFDNVSSAPQQLQSLASFYFPYRMQLLTAEQQQLLQQQDVDQLVAKAQQQLFNPFGAANSALLANDPLLLFPDWLHSLAAGQQYQQQDGILLRPTTTGVAAIISAQGVGSAFNPAAQQQQLQALNHALATVLPDITVLKAGALFHAAAATETATQEISWIGGISLLGVVLLVLWCFRSLMPLSIALLTLASSFVVATAVTLSVFHQLHLLTLVFGTSLVGIAIDYSFHFYCERLQHAKDDGDTGTNSAQRSLTQIMPTLSLALLSSVIAYVALAFTPFPGMRQVALFCASGLIFTWLTLLLAYPLLANQPLAAHSQALAWAQRLSQQLLQRRLPLQLLAIIAVVLVAGNLRLVSNDDVRQLQQSPASVIEPEQQLRQLLSGGTDNQFLLVSGDTPEQLLQKLERLSSQLQQLVQQQQLGSFVSLSRFVPSAQTQQLQHQLQGQIYLQLPQILPQLDLDDSLANALLQQYRTNPTLTIDAWRATEAAKQSGLAQLWLDNQPSYAAIVLLGGIQHLPALTQLAAQDSQLQLVDKVADISRTMAHFRVLTLVLLAATLAVAALLFIGRYGTAQGVKIALVPILAALMTLGSLGWLGAELTLFHSLALILVFGIGVDYSLFFANAKQQTAAVLLAVLLSAISTLLAFGLLGFSQTHAIAAFGQTLTLGILFTLVLALQLALPHSAKES